MAKFSDVNNIGGSYDGCSAMYDFKELLKQAGWSVIGSGDGGSNWSQSGIDYITSAAVLRTNRAWFRLMDPNGVKATGVLTLTGQPLNTETVTLGTKVYTFQTVLTNVDGNVLIGTDPGDSLDNLIAAITLGAGAGTKYAAATTLHPSVTAAAGAGDTMDVTAKSAGTPGNSIATTEALTNGSFGGATLSGGTNGRREFIIQRVSNNYQFRVKYSALDLFTGGAPSATQVPSATDEKVLLGGGTDASPTGTTWFGSTVDSFYYHVIAYSDAIGNVYSFHAFTVDTATGTQYHGFFCEPMAAGTYPSADADPCVILCVANTTGWTIAQLYTSGVNGWYKMNLAGETWCQMCPYLYVAGSYTLLPNNVGLNHYDGKDNGFPILWGRDSTLATQVGHKGFGGRFRMRGTDQRKYPDVVDLSTDAKVYIGDCLVPWENNTMPLL